MSSSGGGAKVVDLSATKSVMVDLMQYLRSEEESKILLRARVQKKEADELKTQKKKEFDALITALLGSVKSVEADRTREEEKNGIVQARINETHNSKLATQQKLASEQSRIDSGMAAVKKLDATLAAAEIESQNSHKLHTARLASEEGKQKILKSISNINFDEHNTQSISGVITFPDRHHARLFDEPIPTPGSAAETASINARWEEMWINFDSSKPLVRVGQQMPSTPALTPIAKK